MHPDADLAPTGQQASLDGSAYKNPTLRIERSKWWRRAIAAGAAVSLLLGAVAWRVPPPELGRSTTGASVYGESVVLAIDAFQIAEADDELVPLAEVVAMHVADALAGSRLIAVVDASAIPTPRDTSPGMGENQDPLGTRFVLHGVLRSAENRVEATVWLVDAASGARLWSQTYNHPPTGPEDLQDDLGDRIAAAAFDEVRDAAREAAARKPASELRAYELVLLANERRWGWTAEGNAEGIELTQKALALEPRSAFAWAELARFYEQRVYGGFAEPGEDAAELWRDAATKAEIADSNYPFARAVLASYHLYAGGWDKALSEANLALTLAPWFPELLAKCAEFLPWLGQSARAAELVDRAKRLDPIANFSDAEAVAYFFAGRFGEAAAAIEWMGSGASRWMQLFATLSYAQVGDEAAAERWRARFQQGWPDYDFQANQDASFSPGATAERALWYSSHRKAGLLPCSFPDGRLDLDGQLKVTCVHGDDYP